MAGFANGLAALMAARGAVPTPVNTGIVPPAMQAQAQQAAAQPAAGGIPLGGVGPVAPPVAATPLGGPGLPQGWQAALGQLGAMQGAPPQMPMGGLSPAALQRARGILAGRR